MESIESKYGIIYFGNQHYYNEDLSRRDYNLENCTPVYFRIGNDEFAETGWINLLPKVANYLIEEYDISKESLMNFKLEWSKAQVFIEKKKVNCIELTNGLHMNCNHTSLHSCWVLQDLMKFCGIHSLSCKLIIKRNPCAEHDEVKEYYKEKHKNEFRSYVLYHLNKDLKYYDSCIKALDSTEKSFKKLFPTFESLYYFDSYTYYASYVNKYIYHLEQVLRLENKKLDQYKKVFKVYSDFLRKEYK